MISSEKYIERLVKEWKKHDKIIIACDYDDTICKWSMDSDYKHVIETLRKAKQLGAYIVIWTASNYIERESNIRLFCSNNGIEIDSINKNPVDLPFGNHGKIYANIYIDDRGGLNESIYILEESIRRVVDDKLISEYKKYNNFISEELGELAVMASVRGWTSSRHEEGIKYRQRINQLELLKK